MESISSWGSHYMDTVLEGVHETPHNVNHRHEGHSYGTPLSHNWRQSTAEVYHRPMRQSMKHEGHHSVQNQTPKFINSSLHQSGHHGGHYGSNTENRTMAHSNNLSFMANSGVRKFGGLADLGRFSYSPASRRDRKMFSTSYAPLSSALRGPTSSVHHSPLKPSRMEVCSIETRTPSPTNIFSTILGHQGLHREPHIPDMQTHPGHVSAPSLFDSNGDAIMAEDLDAPTRMMQQSSLLGNTSINHNTATWKGFNEMRFQQSGSILTRPIDRNYPNGEDYKGRTTHGNFRDQENRYPIQAGDSSWRHAGRNSHIHGPFNKQSSHAPESHPMSQNWAWIVKTITLCPMELLTAFAKMVANLIGWRVLPWVISTVLHCPIKFSCVFIYCLVPLMILFMTQKEAVFKEWKTLATETVPATPVRVLNFVFAIMAILLTTATELVFFNDLPIAQGLKNIDTNEH